jgi:hypothetical protein
MMKVIATAKTQNPKWGFYGTTKTATGANDADTTKVWNAMVKKIKSLYPAQKDAEIVQFLDSRVGRHLADFVASKGLFDVSAILKFIPSINKSEMEKWYKYYNGLTATATRLDKDDRAQVNKLIKIILKYYPVGMQYESYYQEWLRGKKISNDPEWKKVYTESVCREEAFQLLSEGKTSI